MAVKVRKKMKQRSKKVDGWLDRRAAKAHARLERREAKRVRIPSQAFMADVWPAER